MAATNQLAYLFDEKQRNEKFATIADTKKQWESNEWTSMFANQQTVEWQMQRKAQIENEYKTKMSNPENLTDAKIYDLIKQGVTPDADYGYAIQNKSNQMAVEQNKYNKEAMKNRNEQKNTQDSNAMNAASAARNKAGTVQVSESALGMSHNEINGLKSLIGA